MKYIYVGYYQVVEAKYVKIKAENKAQALEKLDRHCRSKFDHWVVDGVVRQKVGPGTGVEPGEDFVE